MVQLSDDLFDALRNDDVKTFRSLLLTQGWPTYSEWSDYHLLVEAIKFGRKEVANFLLDLGCRVYKPGNANTLVHVALTYAGWTDIVLKLINLKASVSSRNSLGDTAVHVAFKNKADELMIDLLLVTYFLETTDNVTNMDGLSTLHIACSRPNVDFVKALTRRGEQIIITREALEAHVHSSYDTGYSRYTPLHFAVKYGCIEVVEFLLQNFCVDIYKVDANASTPLHLALERSDIAILDCILAYDTRLENYVNNMGFSHFMAACTGSNPSIVVEYLRLTQRRPWTTAMSLLKGRVADFGDSSHRGYSPLHFAAEFGRLNNVEILLAHGASCFVMSAENVTPLVVAVKHGHEDVYRMLWRMYKVYRLAICNNVDSCDKQRVKVADKSKCPPGFNDQYKAKVKNGVLIISDSDDQKCLTTTKRDLVKTQVTAKRPGVGRLTRPKMKVLKKPLGLASRNSH